MDTTVNTYVARLLMINRLEYKVADVKHAIQLEMNCDQTIHNKSLASLRVLLTALEREIIQLLENNAEDMNDMYADIMQ